MQKVNPYEVKGDLDYNKVITDFGLKPLTTETQERLDSLAKGSNYMIRRGISVSLLHLHCFNRHVLFLIVLGICPFSERFLDIAEPLSAWNFDIYIL